MPQKKSVLTALRAKLRLAFVLLGAMSIVMALNPGCSQGYKDISTANGRRAVLDEANNALTIKDCETAITLLKPLYESQWVDFEIRMTYASAYACKGGLNFAALAAKLSGFSSGDIWALLVSSNYSKNSSDGKVAALEQAATIVRTTSGTGALTASTRPEEANMYMIFLQMSLIATTISVDSMGAANPSTGKKTQNITGTGTSADECRVQVAFSTISDASGASGATGALNTLLSSVNTACGGACPTNLDPAVCTAVEEAQGAALIIALDAQWGT
jgi:hypothetical protein